MTGIIYSYNAIEFSKQSINEGFMNIENLNYFINKILFIPVN